VRPRIAIPVPHSNPEYAQRVLPDYEKAVEAAGGEPVVIPLDATPEETAKLLNRCQGVLLPGSKADVDPQKYGAEKHAKTEAADPLRDAADELLIQDAYNMRKPILGICYGLQSLNVWRTGTLVQDIASELKSAVKHDAGRKVAIAHSVAIEERGCRIRNVDRNHAAGLRKNGESEKRVQVDMHDERMRVGEHQVGCGTEGKFSCRAEELRVRGVGQ